MRLHHKRDHSAMHDALRRTLSILLAFGDFCLAERMLNAHLGFGRRDLNIHPHLSTVSFNDSDVCSVDAPDSSWNLRFYGHVLLCDCCHSRMAGGSSQVVTKPIVSLTTWPQLQDAACMPKGSSATLQPGRAHGRPVPAASHPNLCWSPHLKTQSGSVVAGVLGRQRSHAPCP